MIKDKEVVLDLKIPVMNNGVEKIADVHIPHTVVDYDENSDVPFTIKEWHGGTMVVDGEIVERSENALNTYISGQSEIFIISIPDDKN